MSWSRPPVTSPAAPLSPLFLPGAATADTFTLSLHDALPISDPDVHAPGSRINLRALLFAGTVLFLLGWPLYAFLSESLTHSINDHGKFKEAYLKPLRFFAIDPRYGTLNDVPAQYRQLDGHRV